uniref:Uncharacterized protein n=1 Tax=Arundo donax TaxID=35708 RepID=A0A0A9EY72_ARUDO
MDILFPIIRRTPEVSTTVPCRTNHHGRRTGRDRYTRHWISVRPTLNPGTTVNPTTRSSAAAAAASSARPSLTLSMYTSENRAPVRTWKMEAPSSAPPSNAKKRQCRSHTRRAISAKSANHELSGNPGPALTMPRCSSRPKKAVSILACTSDMYLARRNLLNPPHRAFLTSMKALAGAAFSSVNSSKNRRRS